MVLLSRLRRRAPTQEQVATILGFLEEQGVPSPRADDPVTLHPPAPQRPRVRVTSTTQEPRDRGPTLSEQLAPVQVQRVLPCFPNLPCWAQPGCCNTEKNYIPPAIAWDSFPVRIPSMTLRASLDPTLEGEVRTRFLNQSEEGEVVTVTTCTCRGGDEGRDQRTVDGSADLQARNRDLLRVPDVGTTLDEVEERFPTTAPDVSRETEASFRKDAALDILKSILDLAATGTLPIRARVRSRVTYRWLGRTQTEEQTFHVDADLPVDEINLEWG